MDGSKKSGFSHRRRKPYLPALFAFVAASSTVGAVDAPLTPSGATAAPTLTMPVLEDRSWTPEQRASFEKIEGDLHRAGIPSADHINPFPDRTPTDAYVENRDHKKLYEGFYLEWVNGGPSFLVGIARQGEMREFMTKPLNVTYQCALNEVVDPGFFENLRILDYIHEVAHRVSSQRHLTDAINKELDNTLDEHFSKIKNANAHAIQAIKADIAANINERQADATVAIYVMSNLPQFTKELEYFRDRRVVEVLKVHDHNTGNSINAAMTAFANAPRPNLSLIEAAEWAQHILKEQKETLIGDYVINNGVIGLHTGKYGQMSKGKLDEPDLVVQTQYNLLRATEQGLCIMHQAAPAQGLTGKNPSATLGL